MGVRLKHFSLGCRTSAESPRDPGGRVMANGPRYLDSCGFALFALCWVALNFHEIFGVWGKGAVQPCLVLLAWTGNKESSWPGL